jgi:capsular polysaccharide transport system permease protein
MSTVIAVLRRHRALLLALLWREEKSRFQDPMESIMALLEPLFMIALLTFVWKFLGRRQMVTVGESTALFHSIGFFPMYFFIYLSRNIRASAGTPQRRFPLESRLDLILVSMILRTVDFTILGILLFTGLYIFATPDAIPVDFVVILEASVAILMLGFGFGIFNLVLAKTFWLWSYVNAAITRSIMLFSGLFFVPDFFTPDVRYDVSFNPLLHAILLFKTGFNPPYPHLILDKSYLWAWSFSFVFFGLVLERLTWRTEGR